MLVSVATNDQVFFLYWCPGQNDMYVIYMKGQNVTIIMTCPGYGRFIRKRYMFTYSQFYSDESLSQLFLSLWYTWEKNIWFSKYVYIGYPCSDNFLIVCTQGIVWHSLPVTHNDKRRSLLKTFSLPFEFPFKVHSVSYHHSASLRTYQIIFWYFWDCWMSGKFNMSLIRRFPVACCLCWTFFLNS